MQSVWLTRGGPGTKGGPDDSNCNYQANGYTCDPFDPTDEKSDSETPRSKYEYYYSNNRLDYVFVEKPKRAHELKLDLSRAKMVGQESDHADYLSDHPGIAFDLLTSPAE